MGSRDRMSLVISSMEPGNWPAVATRPEEHSTSTIRTEQSQKLGHKNSSEVVPRYMQPKTSEELQERVETSPISRTSSSDREHGFAQSALEPDAAPVKAPSARTELVFRREYAGSSSVPSSTLSGLGLNSPLPFSVGNRNRVAEYENSLSITPKKKHSGPAFDVVKTDHTQSDNMSPFVDLPNEILIHALANLSPVDLNSVALVSKKFHDLVSTQHAWRAAFSRFFPCSEAIRSLYHEEDDDGEDQETLVAPKRDFTRLTALASWRSEYILRIRLLRSLARGKPVQPAGPLSATRSGQSHVAAASVKYNSQMFTTINHVHANFGMGLNKRIPHFIHGADEAGTACFTDPTTAKTQNWGFTDPNTFVCFQDRYPGDAMYGLGTGQIVGVPNVMDVSEPFGMLYGEGFPEGMIYFRPAEEMRGRFLEVPTGVSAPELGIPKLPVNIEAITSVWIAKSSNIPQLTGGMIGILAGSSLGILTSYSLGPLSARDQKFGRGKVTAKWVLCPGVPIIGIAVDDDHSFARQGSNRIWAAVLNALGEVFYITKFPARSAANKSERNMTPETLERLAWQSGRSVCWTLLEPTRRTARPDPYRDHAVDGSYTPRGSWNGMCLSLDQIKAETLEIEAYLRKKPVDVQSSCLGWDMRRTIQVDFAGDDGGDAGESVIVIAPGLDEDSVMSVTRFARVRTHSDDPYILETRTPPLTDASTAVSTEESLFGGISKSSQNTPNSPIARGVASVEGPGLDEPGLASTEEWRTTMFDFDDMKSLQITASTLDTSTYATMTAQEDPILNFSGASAMSSPSLTPLSFAFPADQPSTIPGSRSRLFALGTSMGSILVYNIRAAIPPTSLSTTLTPVRIIHTSSPSISCLALTALYLVHGGSDGLVQAWDPLASSPVPIRTLHSRFSSRARRRLAQAAVSAEGVGINLWAAGAIALDPDPTSLRGVVSLGTHLFYWHFSSGSADAYRSHKRRLRRAERGSNSGGEKYVPTPRQGGTRRFIENERFELEREVERERKEDEYLKGRFGTGLLGESATEEELLAYAEMISRETAGATTPTAHAEAKHTAGLENAIADDEDPEIAEAIRLSLAETPVDSPASGQGTWQDQEDFGLVPVKYGKFARRTPKGSPSVRAWKEGSLGAHDGADKEDDDLEFALEISMAEERSRRETELEWERVEKDVVEEFPGLPSKGKGKGRAA